MARLLLLLVAMPPVAAAVLNVKNGDGEEACVAEDLRRRAQLQNKLAGVCEDMCREVEAYPRCGCPAFVEPDSTPGVMTWPELLGHMDSLAEWGRDSIKGWHRQASQLQTAKNATSGALGARAAAAQHSTQGSGAVMSLKAKQLMEVTVGGFPSAPEACDYCFGSFTKTGVPPAGPVAPACVCMSYPDGAEHNMFCATPVSAAQYVKEKGGCLCQARDMESMGQTTCDPY